MASLCNVNSKRSLLALLWSIVISLSVLGYLITLGVTLESKFYNIYDNENRNEDEDEDRDDNRWEDKPTVSIASGAMLFSFIWTGMSTIALGTAGTMVLGILSPSGKHYTCFPAKVLQTSPMTIGAFVGSLVMFANLLFICAILFGQFNIRDYSYGEGQEEERGEPEMQWLNSYAIRKSSAAFSFLCLFQSLLYAGFSVVLYTHQNELMQEILDDARAEALAPSPDNHMTLHPSGNYIGGAMEQRNKFITNKDIPELN